MKITGLRILHYRGVEQLSTKVAPSGLVVAGENGAGKTSVIKAIRAALAAQDIGPDAIRIGHDRAEILVNLDDVSVKRVITAKGSKLTIEGPDATPKKAPQAWLNDLLGTAPLDPIDLFHAKKAERKEMILKALPISVSRAELDKWLVGLPAIEEIDKVWERLAPLHGLEIVDQVRKLFATARTEHNGRAKELEAEVAALEAGAPPAVPNAKPVTEAEQAQRAAAAALADMQARSRRVEEQATKTKGTRDHAKELREHAAKLDAEPWPDQQDIATAAAAVVTAQAHAEEVKARVVALEAELVAARQALETARSEHRVAVTVVGTLDAAVAVRHSSKNRADDLRAQADGLEAAIAATLDVAPSAEEIQAAELAEQRAEVDRVAAHAAALRTAHEAKLNAVRTRLSEAHEAAGRLTGAVERFTKEVPNQLTTSNGIPGLVLDGDAVFLDGVRIDALSGREQLLFAVEVSRRLNARSKILIVDGLERVDASNLDEFVKAATAGGFQLLATRVEAKDVVIEAIEPDGAPPAERQPEASA